MVKTKLLEKTVFSTRLRELRTSANLTQGDVALATGVSRSSINMYERGEREPGLDFLINVSNFFGVSVDWMVGNKRKEK